MSNRKLQKVEIKGKDVFIDGNRIDMITSLQLNMNVGEPSTLLLEIFVKDIDIDIDVENVDIYKKIRR